MRQEHTLLLRSPQFPGVSPEISGVDAGGVPVSVAAAYEAIGAADAMAAHRVGGCFWGDAGGGPPLPDRDCPELPGGAPDDAAAVAPRGRCSAARHWGTLVVGGALVDPWPLIEVADVVMCRQDAEIGVLAFAAGKQARHDPSRHDGREVERPLWDDRGGRLPFLEPTQAIARAKQERGAVAAWPAWVPADFAERAAAAGVPVRWMEDGFLRSAGLGSDLLPPLSLVVDDH